MKFQKIMLLSLLIPCAIVSIHKPQSVRLIPNRRPISRPFAEAKQAIDTNNVEKIRALLKTNPDILNQTDKVGQTLLTLNIINRIQDDAPVNLTIFKLLLEAGASVKNPNDLILLTEKTGNSPREGSLEAMRLLLERGANINGVNQNKKTALIQAAQDGNVQAVKFILHQGSAATDLKKTTTSYLSILPKEITEIVSKYVINTNIKDNKGKTALDYAIQGYNFNEKASKDEGYLKTAYRDKTYKEMVDNVESAKKDYQEIINLLEPITDKEPAIAK